MTCARSSTSFTQRSRSSRQLQKKLLEERLGISRGRDERGRLQPHAWRLRLLIYKWLLRRTPPAAIMLNFVDAEALLAPGLNVPFPDLTMIRKMRQEATLLGEGVAAYRIASAKRIVSFGFDETTKFGDGLASTNFQIETASGEICDEVLRGAFLIPGGCADQVAKAIELKLFARGRQLLDKVRSIYESKHGDGSWPGPKPVQLSYRRLAGALVMSDTCHAARAAKKFDHRVCSCRRGEGVDRCWAVGRHGCHTEAGCDPSICWRLHTALA